MAARVRGTHKKATGTGPQSIKRVAGAPTERTQLRALVPKDEPLSAAYGSLNHSCDRGVARLQLGEAQRVASNATTWGAPVRYSATADNLDIG
jgi:hypothetical protein